MRLHPRIIMDRLFSSDVDSSSTTSVVVSVLFSSIILSLSDIVIIHPKHTIIATISITDIFSLKAQKARILVQNDDVLNRIVAKKRGINIKQNYMRKNTSCPVSIRQNSVCLFSQGNCENGLIFKHRHSTEAMKNMTKFLMTQKSIGVAPFLAASLKTVLEPIPPIAAKFINRIAFIRLSFTSGVAGEGLEIIGSAASSDAVRTNLN